MDTRRLAAALIPLCLLLSFSLSARAALAAPAGGPFRVLIDAGHGGSDPGAIGTVVPLVEKDVTLRVALLTGAALQRRGVQVSYTRSDDRYVALAERAAMAGRVGASLLISLHVNSAGSPGVSGAEAWHGAGAGADLAGAVLSGLAPVLRDHGLAVRGTRHGPELVVLRAAAPAALIELGYASHPREAVLLTQPAYLERLAEGIAAGVVRFRDGARATSSPAAPSATAPLPMTDLYFIRPGDTLQSIAGRFRTAAGELIRLNPVVDPQRLLPGSPIHVPAGEAVVASWSSGSPAGAAPAARAPRAAAEVHVVQPGETLSGIALRYGLATDDLARWNAVTDARRLLVGQHLRLRPATGTAAAAPAAPAAASTASDGGSAGAGRTARSYRVQPGDTLSEIALRHGVTTDALLAANRLQDPNRVVSGTTLAIPAGA